MLIELLGDESRGLRTREQRLTPDLADLLGWEEKILTETGIGAVLYW